MNKSLRDELTETDEGLRLWQQETTILKITELICGQMASMNVSRSELARRMGTTPGHVSQLLNGTKNMTVRTISDVFTSLGLQFDPGFSFLREEFSQGSFVGEVIRISSEDVEFPTESTTDAESMLGVASEWDLVSNV